MPSESLQNYECISVQFYYLWKSTYKPQLCVCVCICTYVRVYILFFRKTHLSPWMCLNLGKFKFSVVWIHFSNLFSGRGSKDLGNRKGKLLRPPYGQGSQLFTQFVPHLSPQGPAVFGAVRHKRVDSDSRSYGARIQMPVALDLSFTIFSLSLFQIKTCL